MEAAIVPVRAQHGRCATWLAAIFGIALGMPGFAVQAETVYVYKNERGSILITDHPRTSPGYALIKRYGTEPTVRTGTRERPIASAFDTLIDAASRVNRLDSALLRAVVHAESAFDPDAVSHKGAVGLMQLMATTAKSYGVSDRTDPWQNLQAGARHLRYLLDRYQDTALALAAYNAGGEAVRRYRGVPPYPETESYVQKVLQLHELYREKG